MIDVDGCRWQDVGFITVRFANCSWFSVTEHLRNTAILAATAPTPLSLRAGAIQVSAKENVIHNWPWHCHGQGMPRVRTVQCPSCMIRRFQQSYPEDVPYPYDSIIQLYYVLYVIIYIHDIVYNGWSSSISMTGNCSIHASNDFWVSCLLTGPENFLQNNASDGKQRWRRNRWLARGIILKLPYFSCDVLPKTGSQGTRQPLRIAGRRPGNQRATTALFQLSQI